MLSAPRTSDFHHQEPCGRRRRRMASSNRPAGSALQARWSRERPDVDAAPQGVIGRLHRLAGFLTEELLVVYRKYGLAEGDFDALATLRRAGAPYERAAGELADFTMVTTRGVTKRIDRLERAGLVTRRASEQDGRGRVVTLTG